MEISNFIGVVKTTVEKQYLSQDRVNKLLEMGVSESEASFIDTGAGLLNTTPAVIECFKANKEAYRLVFVLTDLLDLIPKNIYDAELRIQYDSIRNLWEVCYPGVGLFPTKSQNLIDAVFDMMLQIRMTTAEDLDERYRNVVEKLNNMYNLKIV